MKKIAYLIIIFLILIAGFVFKKPITTYAENIFYQSQCDTPTTYRIGNVDPNFNMTRDQFMGNVKEAGVIWSSARNRTLFAYDPKGDITINLIYDKRQLLNNQIDELNTEVKSKQQDLDPQIEAYKNRASEFKNKMVSLNKDIDSWNNRGGAPPEEYEKLKSRQNALEQEAAELQKEALRLNQSTSEYNEQVGVLHQTVENFNQELQFKPEEGEYIVDNGVETINVYFDNSREELIHTLAHELGHALSIGHNNNPLSIMYPQTTETISLSPDDIAGLEKACEKRSVIKTGFENLSLIVNNLQTQIAR